MAEQYNLFATIDVGCEADGRTSNAVPDNRLLASSFDSDFGGL